MRWKALITVPLVFLENILFSIFPGMRQFIEQHLFNPYAFHEKHLAYSIAQFKGFLEKIGGTSQIVDKNILELGPGGSIGFGLLALKYGAKKYYVIENISHTFITNKQLLSYRKLLEDNGVLISKYFIKNTANQYAYNPAFIEFIKIGQDSSYKLPDESIDIIYSCAVLEHVHDLDLCFTEMARVLRRDGIMNHQVDLRDHIFSQKSIWFLNFSDYWFDKLFKNTGEYVNRKRLSDYEKLIHDKNLEILDLEQNILFDKKLPKNLTKKYSEYDLRNLSFNILLKKK
ncbi:MAG: class I SAM-dependent methyltransferase [Candidatus Moraniibacteriota bacterium]